MVSFKSISFYSRFLTAPLLSIILTMVTYLILLKPMMILT